MGTRKNRFAEAVLTSTHNLCFEQKYEKYKNFYLEIFLFLVVKFSIYLNRHVFVMTSLHKYNIKKSFRQAQYSVSRSFQGFWNFQLKLRTSRITSVKYYYSQIALIRI